MSLLNGLKEAMINPLFDAVNEADTDAEFEFEMALEAVVDKQIELSEDDYAAIMDDENPDNIVADITDKDENISKIADDAMDDDMQALESMLDELLANEGAEDASAAQDEIPGDDPETLEGCSTGCNTKATEMDEDDTEYDEDDETDEVVSLDALLNSIFEN